jgi:hypothetical protein
MWKERRRHGRGKKFVERKAGIVGEKKGERVVESRGSVRERKKGKIGEIEGTLGKRVGEFERKEGGSGRKSGVGSGKKNWRKTEER